jgi:hypothetical protein
VRGDLSEDGVTNALNDMMDFWDGVRGGGYTSYVAALDHIPKTVAAKLLEGIDGCTII